MTGVPIQQMADRVAGLMEERLQVPGRGLTEKLRHGGHRLPRKVRAAATELAEAAVAAQNPKFLMRIDQEKVARAYDLCVHHLGRLNAAERRIGAIVDFTARVAFSLLVVAAGLWAVLRWRGYL